MTMPDLPVPIMLRMINSFVAGLTLGMAIVFFGERRVASAIIMLIGFLVNACFAIF